MEKVIDALKFDGISNNRICNACEVAEGDCNACYDNPEGIHVGFTMRNDLEEELNQAKEAIEKQTAKKVIMDIYPMCPNCNSNVRNYTESEDFNCCPNCGQKLEW